MGCGSSSLKGDQPADLGGDTPAKRVKTNFSDVDFTTGAAADRRGTMALAPDEHSRPSRVSEGNEDVPPVPKSPTKAKTDTDGGKLEPYKSIDDGTSVPNNLNAASQPTTAAQNLQVDGLPRNEEATAFATAGTEHANPIKTVA